MSAMGTPATVGREPSPQTSDDVAPPTRRLERSDVRRAVGYSLKVWLGARVGLALVVLAAVGLIQPNETTSVPGWPAPPSVEGFDNVATGFERWDGLWFLRIADQGYSEADTSAAFFPLYPTVVRGVSTLLGDHPLGAALLVSHVAFLAALVVVYLLTKLEFDDDMARRATLFMAVWPTAFFFFSPYSESIFLLLAAGAVLAARLQRWAYAAVLGALAAATRSVGLVLVVVLATEALTQLRERRGKARAIVWPLVCSAAVGLGTLAYLAYWKAQTGDWFAPIGEQGNWQREFTFPVKTVIDGTLAAFEFIGVGAGGYPLLDWLVVIPSLALAVWVALRTRPAYGIYAWASLLLPLTFIFGARPFMSLPRFTVVIWPLFWALAWASKKWDVQGAIVASSAAGLGLFTTLFVNWYWIF